jgi:hypothetical protein
MYPINICPTQHIALNCIQLCLFLFSFFFLFLSLYPVPSSVLTFSTPFFLFLSIYFLSINEFILHLRMPLVDVYGTDGAPYDFPQKEYLLASLMARCTYTIG